METRKTSEVIEDIKKLIQTRGYIYALCMIIFEDFHIILEEIHKVNFRDRLNKNEVSFLIGFLIQRSIDFSYPNEPSDIIELKQKTYSLMKELHNSMLIHFAERMQNVMEKKEDSNK